MCKKNVKREQRENFFELVSTFTIYFRSYTWDWGIEYTCKSLVDYITKEQSCVNIWGG